MNKVILLIDDNIKDILVSNIYTKIKNEQSIIEREKYLGDEVVALWG